MGLMGFSGSLPLYLFIDIISLCLLIGQTKMLTCLLLLVPKCSVTEAVGCEHLPKVVVQQHHGRASNLRPLGRKSDALPLSHRATPKGYIPLSDFYKIWHGRDSQARTLVANLTSHF